MAGNSNSDRSDGSWNQTIGSAKEAMGGMLGNENAGRKQNLEGQEQEARGQLSDLGSGMASRAQGTIGSAVAGITGDKDGKAHYDKMRTEGEHLQRDVEKDLQKKAEAERK